MTRSTEHPTHDSPVDLSEHLVQILPRLRRHVSARHAHGNAEDIVQEALLRALQSSDSFRPNEDPWPWVRTIADRVAMRRSQRERLEPISLDGTEAEPAAHASDTGEDVESARALLARLQGPERHALERYYLDGMSVAEIAKAESSPQGTIKARLSRGRGRLMLMAAATLGIAIVVMVSLRRATTDAPAPSDTESATTMTLHYASFTVEDVAPYQPTFQTIDLRPSTKDRWQVTISTEDDAISSR